MNDSCDNHDQNSNKKTKAGATKQQWDLQKSQKKQNERRGNGWKSQRNQLDA